MSALFFDLDGTLVDSERQHWQAWRATLLPIGINLSWPEYEATIGLPDHDTLSWLAKRAAGLFDRIDATSVLDQKKREFIALVKKLAPMSLETREMLRQVSHFDLALVTSSSRVETLEILDRAAVTHHFKTIVCLEDIQYPKPHPEPYAVAMKNMAVTQGIAFEDSAAGKASAKAAGLEVIEVSNPADLCAIMRSKLPLHVV